MRSHITGSNIPQEGDTGNKGSRLLNLAVSGISSILHEGLKFIDEPQQTVYILEDTIDDKKYSLLYAGNMDSPYGIVSIHGLVGNMENFLPQMLDDKFGTLAHIAPNRFKNLIVDQKQMIDRENPMEVIVDYLHSIITNHLGDRKIFLHGASLGGEIAYNYAAKYPDQVKGIILCGASGLHNESFLGGKENIYEKIKNLGWIQQKVNEHFVDPRMAPENLAKTLQEMLQDRRQLIGLAALGQTSVKSDQIRNQQLLQKIQQKNIPIQLMRGEKDSITPHNIAVPKFQEYGHIPQQNIAIFSNANHMPNMDASQEEYNRLLKAFINRTILH